MANTFAFLPRPGECITFAGGLMICRTVQVNRYREAHVTGTILFEFECSEQAYAEPAALPAAQLALPG